MTIEKKPLYTAADLNRFDPERQLGRAGDYPFTRGIHPTMYRGRLWTMRQFAGFGSAVDTNRRAVGDDYFPRAFVFSGSGNYVVELSQPNIVLSANTSSTISMGANNIVLVRDTFLNAGTAVTITVTPSNTGQDPELLLMSSDASTPGTFVRGRVSAAVSSTGHGAGVAESFTFTPNVSQWYGVVVTNKAGSGSLTLRRT